MFTKEAIQELAGAQSIQAAEASLAIGLRHGPTPALGHVALPSDFHLHDLEAFLPKRRRKRGHMNTSLIVDFAGYVGANTEEAATAFIDEAGMKAVAVLNLGTPEEPGHCDHHAIFTPVKTAVYAALLGVANGQDKAQRVVAEWMEDWIEMIDCFAGEDELATKTAISAVRDLTVERASRENSKVADMRAEVSAFESAAARGRDAPLPGRLELKIEPYHGFAPREFKVRVGVRLDGPGGKPMLVLRVINLELHQQEMAAEMASMVRAAVSIPAVVGSFRAG